MGVRRVLGGAAVLLAGSVVACGADAPDTSDVGSTDAAVPTGVATACPPPQTRLRLAGDELPSGAVAVRLCPGPPIVGWDGSAHGPFAQAPVDELTSGVASLVDLVNDLPPFDPATACPSDGGPRVAYWFRYPDGDARAVLYGEHGCHTVTAGEGRVVRDGDRLAAAFADALARQRRSTSPPQAVAAVEVPRCGEPLAGPTSFLPQVPLAMTSATLCRATGPYRTRSATIPPRLLEAVNTRLLSHPPRRSAPCRTRQQLSIEGVTAWGDRVSYLLPRCELYTRTGYGRETNFSTLPVDPRILGQLVSLELGPVERWDD